MEVRGWGIHGRSHRWRGMRRAKSLGASGSLGEMDGVIPWPRLVRLIEPHYPKAGHGRQPLGLEKMLRIYFLQQWFNLSGPQAEDAIYDSESMRRFVGVELGDEVCRTRPRFCAFAICWSSMG